MRVVGKYVQDYKLFYVQQISISCNYVSRLVLERIT
jgi:hypothetical protein